MSNRKRKKSNSKKGFTLLEVLLVLVILVVLGSMATIFVRRARKQAFYNTAKAQIDAFASPLEMYESDNLRFPNSAEGLEALRVPPGGGDPYLNKNIPTDPWGNPYQYELLNQEQYRIWSWGADGLDNTADDVIVEAG